MSLCIPEIYTFAGPSEPSLPPFQGSPRGCDEEPVYDDQGVLKSTVSPSQATSVPNKGDMEKQTAPSTSTSMHGKDSRRMAILTLYCLVTVCFVMWAVLLSVVLVKYMAISEQLKILTINQSEILKAVTEDLDNRQKEQEIMQSTMGREISELQSLTASICKTLSMPPTLTCPTNWEIHKRTCYYFSTEEKSWDEALQYCGKRRAHLVTVNTEDEQKFLKEHGIINNRTYWLGMTDAVKDGKWKWKYNDRSIYVSFWEHGEPKSGDQDCGIIHPIGTWSTAMCSQTYRWICEMKLIC